MGWVGKPWTFTLPGQPISWNHAYKNIVRHGRRGAYSSRAKTPAAEAYQQAAVAIIKSAMPSGWKPKGQVRITFRLHLQREMDCDNAMKLIHDAIQTATKVNDKYFLPTVEEKSTRWGSKAKVVVTVEDLGSVSQAPRTSRTTRSRSSTSSRSNQSRRGS